jgi:hypothetical protein
MEREYTPQDSISGTAVRMLWPNVPTNRFFSRVMIFLERTTKRSAGVRDRQPHDHDAVVRRHSRTRTEKPDHALGRGLFLTGSEMTTPRVQWTVKGAMCCMDKHKEQQDDFTAEERMAKFFEGTSLEGMRFSVGQKVRGRIVRITEDRIVLDLGENCEGYILRKQWRDVE